ncbi:MAG TPA: glycosyl hydrolase family 8 [Chloroflexia bacterium]|nr:glycosyl hydrolase family 8 [Chloroflexia bacterium]
MFRRGKSNNGKKASISRAKKVRRFRKGRLLALVSVGLLLLVSGLTLAMLVVQPAAPAEQASLVAGPTPTYDGAAVRATLAARHDAAPVLSPGPTPINLAQSPASSPAATAGTLPGITPTAILADPKSEARQQLQLAWESYKHNFIQADGRVIDPMFGNLTTSEGQSYALLRAVWMNDRASFDLALRWSQNNLQVRPGDKLFGYKWGNDGNGNWRLVEVNSASDADVDIALALLFGSKRWNEASYQKQALELLNSIWNREVVHVLGKPYLTAGDWAPAQAKPTLNPSYLSPYAYRIFATVDRSHDWQGLVDTSYNVIKGCSETVFEGVGGAHLPANWCAIDRTSGSYTVAQSYPDMNTNYGYDAFRTMWRVALDYTWFNEPRAFQFLTRSDALRQKWQQEGRLLAEYDHAGKPVQPREDLAVYGGDLANFLVTDAGTAETIVKTKILPAFQQQNNNSPASLAGWGDLHNYYTQNWAWFGLALYCQKLENLSVLGAVTSN